VSLTGVVDSHIHFWDPARLHYAWLKTEPRLNRAFLPADIPRGRVPLEALVFVEADRRASEALAEVEWVVGLSSPSGRVAGVVAAALHRQSAEADLDALQRRGEVKGIRRLLQDVRPGFSTDPAFLQALSSLEGRELVFDLCVRGHQLAEATALVRQCPGVTFVLDHLGKPAVQHRPDRIWLTDIARLAALPNVRCKLSGLSSEVRDAVGDAPVGDRFAPYLDHALQTFGPARCMFGSDWPVASLTISYEAWFDRVCAALARFPLDDLEQVVRRTAIATYRLGQTRYTQVGSAKVPHRADPDGGVADAWR